MAVVIEPQSPSQNATQDSPYGPMYKVGKDVTAPVVLKSVEAKFPKSGHDAKKGFHAIVIVRLVVDAEGCRATSRSPARTTPISMPRQSKPYSSIALGRQ